jgi:hypothetical protein
MDGAGNVYETSSVHNGSVGVSRIPDYVDQGNVALGETSPKIERVRRMVARKNAAKLYAHKMHKLRQAQSAARAVQLENERTRRNHMMKLAAAKAFNRGKNIRTLEAIGQPREGMDFDPLMGDPFSGFAEEGVVVHSRHLIGEGVREHISSRPNFNRNSIGLGAEPAKPTTAIAVPKMYRIEIYQHPLLVYGSGLPMYGDLGWPKFLKAIGRGIAKAAKGVAKGVGAVARGVGRAAKGIGKVALKGVRLAGKLTSEAIKLTVKVVNKIPVVGHVYRGVDKLTGGALTTATNIATLPGRAIAGEPITKAELMKDLAFVARVGAVILTGGSAAAVIGATSGVLKDGPIGKSKIGRALLSVGEVAGFATAGYMAATKEVAAKAATQTTTSALQTGATQAAAKAGTQVATQAATQAGTQVAQASLRSAVQGALIQKGQDVAKEKAIGLIASKTGAVGGLIAGVAMSDPSKLDPSNLSETVKNFDPSKYDPRTLTQEQVLGFAEVQAKKKAASEFEKKTGVSVAQAGFVTDIVTGEKSPMVVPDMITAKVSAIELKAKNFSPPDAQALLSNNAEALSVKIADIPNTDLSKLDREKIKAQVVKEEATRFAKAQNDATQAAKLATEEGNKLVKLTAEAKAVRAKADKAQGLEKIALAEQATALERKVVEQDKKLGEVQQVALKKVSDAKLIEGQAAIKVAAAEEGRYYPGFVSDEYSHPLVGQMGS